MDYGTFEPEASVALQRSKERSAKIVAEHDRIIWNAAIDAAIEEARNQNRVGREWVHDSIWDRIISRVPEALEKLKR